MRSRSEGRVELFRVFWRRFEAPFSCLDDRSVRTRKTRRPGCETRLFVLNIGPGQGFLVIAERGFLGFHYNLKEARDRFCKTGIRAAEWQCTTKLTLQRSSPNGGRTRTVAGSLVKRVDTTFSRLIFGMVADTSITRRGLCLSAFRNWGMVWAS